MNERSLLLKDLVKKMLGLLPFAVTQNQRYDRQTNAIIRRVCRRASNCVDVGTHRGEILDTMRQAAPEGTHFGFEPLPHFYDKLQQRYAGVAGIEVFPYALSEAPGEASFNHVKTNPAYSGLQKRRYDRPHEEDETITVEMRTLDEVVGTRGVPIALIKIDVEGGEMGVLRGARGLLARDKPVVIFEAGIGGSDVYGTTPGMLFDYLSGFGYRVSLMGRYLKGQPPFSRQDFAASFNGGHDYYFIAY
ncbi:FkbM family methyltransferase [Flaviaesturariibacter flavus]|uniref:FkbM family methyltransferase n=1 Tax=Flaviaesturariibacter flavus TaxID=2502780 RepID=A0A4R1B5P9_9BACT|nr:FkbM family methyltransferase [Flaviaesturariibacter flavus]TCJ13321.1 FkbM family methyltransferase [Flaviaesturariibacter flavus]